MKKSVCFLIAFCTLAFIGFSQDFYSISLKSIDGNKIDMNLYKGKKVLIMIIPLNDSGAAMIDELAVFKTSYGGKIEMIGIPAIEEGYQNGDKNKVKKIYKQDRNMDIIITEGIKVKKGSGADQSELFKWLTNNTRNGHFNQDVKGVGHKFFVNEKGKLYAVLDPQASLSHKVITRIVNQPAGN